MRLLSTTIVHGVHGGLRLRCSGVAAAAAERLAHSLANILPVVFYGVSTRPYLTNVHTVKELRNAEKIRLYFRNFPEEYVPNHVRMFLTLFFTHLCLYVSYYLISRRVDSFLFMIPYNLKEVSEAEKVQRKDDCY